MSKRVELTQKIRDLISKNTDGAVDPSMVAVYECIAANTLPLNKRGTLFDKGRLSEGILKSMADWVNDSASGKSVPLHTLHEQGYELPIGRCFFGESRESSPGVTELRMLFYVPLSEADIVSKLDANVIDEVSVGVRPNHICCSECGFDYLGADATFEHIWTQTCENGHTIGTDGVHTISSGLNNFMELSLVSKGAANNAKILSRTKQLLGQEEYNRLAASGVKPELTVLFSTATKDTAMEMKELIADLTSVKASVIGKDAEIARLTADFSAQADKLKALEGENAELKAKVDTNVDQLKADCQAAQEQVKVTLSFVREEADRLCVAAGVEKLPETADLEALTASIKTNRTKLSEMFPGAGAALEASAGSGIGDKLPKASAGFKVPK